MRSKNANNRKVWRKKNRNKGDNLEYNWGFDKIKIKSKIFLYWSNRQNKVRRIVLDIINITTFEELIKFI